MSTPPFPRASGTSPSSMADGSRSRRPRLVLAVVAAAALAVLAVVALLFLGDEESTGSTDAGARTSQPVPAPPPSPVPPSLDPPVTPRPAAPIEPIGGSGALPPELPAVPLDAPAEAGDGVVASLPRLESVQGTGTGPGNVAGPALRVTVRLANGTPAPVSLDSVTVNVYYGEDRTPASPLDDPSSAPFQGTVAAGRSAEGVFVVRVPSGAGDIVTVEVGHRPGAPLIIFSGPVR